MVNEKLIIPKVEEIREIKYEIPTYEEFMKNYKGDKTVADSYSNEINAQTKGYGPTVCSPCAKCELCKVNEATFDTLCSVCYWK